MDAEAANGRSLAAIINEVREEFEEFVQTRLELLKKEVRQTLQILRVAVPLAATAALFLLTAYVLMTLALVGLLAAVFAGNPFRWFLAFLIMAVAWAIVGAVAGVWALGAFKKGGLVPRRTIQVLKADKIWLQQEAKERL